MERSHRKMLILAMAIAIAGLAPSLVRSTESATAERVEDALRFREAFGLRSDIDFVSQIAADPTADVETFGVPLSKSEIADLMDRAKIREDFTPALARAIESPGYAGAYIDQLRHGQPVILTTDPDALRVALSSVSDSAALAEVQVAKHSLAELQEMKATFTGTRDELERQGIDVVSVGIDIEMNRILVGIDGVTDKISSDLASRFGDTVGVREDRAGEFDACTVASCWPMKGGLRIRIVSNPSSGYCTAGFMATKTDTGALSLLTAGHCIALNNTANARDYWGHANSPADAVNIGYEAPFNLNQGYHTWFNNSTADAGLIVLDTESIAALPSNSLNLLHISDPGGSGFVTSVRSVSQQLPNDMVCRMGYGTYLGTGSGQGVTCGKIVDPTDVDHDSCNASGSTCNNITRTWEVDFDSVGGDSGGPIFHLLGPGAYSAYGTHVHSWVTGDPLPKHGWYSPITISRSAYQAVAGFTFDVCVTSMC
jgi:hypothetical protein